MVRVQFFEILAQIRPVILLGYVLEGRLHEKERATGLRDLRVAGFAFAMVAEAAALLVVSGAVRGTPSGRCGSAASW